MRRHGLILIITLWSALPVMQLSAGPSQPSRYDPAQHHESRQRTGFVDSVLDRINPTEIEYGQLLEEDRHVVLRTTLQSLYFRVAIVSSGAAMLFFFWLLHAARQRERQEILAARFLTWYHNQLVRAQEAALEAASRHEQLRRLIDGERMHKPVAQISPSAADSGADVGAETSPSGRASPQTNKPIEPSNVEPDIVKAMQAQIVRLQRQLADERQKNRKLKGD